MFSLEEFHQHVVLAYAENIFVIFRYIWPPESKSEWCKCVHVKFCDLGEKMEFLVKKYVYSMFQSFYVFFFSFDAYW